MQITIIQSEIETAIRNYIMSQITVREGQRIDIDLKATRGPEGYQAVIDIVPDTSPAPVRKSSDDEPAKETPKPKAKAFAARETKAEVATQEVEASGADVPETAPETEAETQVEEDTQDAAPPEASDDKPTTAPKSIFANMKRSVNA